MANENVIKFHGSALWSKCVEPDYTYKPEGEFSIKVVISPEEFEKYNDSFTADLEAYLEETIASLPAAKQKSARATIKINDWAAPDLDQNGDETGDYQVRCTRKSVFVSKKHNKEYPQRIALFLGSPSAPLNATEIGNGSTVVVAVIPRPYFIAASKAVGMSFQLQAVLVKKLVEVGTKEAGSIFDDEVDEGEFAKEEAPEPVSAEKAAKLRAEEKDEDF